MSLLLGAAAGMGALGLANARGPSSVGEPAKPGKATVAVRYTSSGVYGDIKDIGDIIGTPGMFVGSIADKDLLGVPFRWLIMRNGCPYKTYDMKFPPVPITNSAEN
jgi:hypothetical protein